MTPEQQLAALYIVAVGTISLLAIGGLVYVSYRYDRAVQALAPDIDAPELRPDGGVETGGSEQLVREREACYKHLVALLKRRDRIYRKTQKDPLEGAGPWIKAAGIVRDELDDHPYYESIDPDEVFRYLDTDSDHREGPP